MRMSDGISYVCSSDLYYYQASSSTLETVAADELGYFDDLCLDVVIQPGTGETGQNTQLLASGQVTFTGVAQQEVISAQQNGIDILGISAYSNVGLEVLMTRPEVTDLADLDRSEEQTSELQSLMRISYDV